jgi:hypothetical protein
MGDKMVEYRYSDYRDVGNGVKYGCNGCGGDATLSDSYPKGGIATSTTIRNRRMTAKALGLTGPPPQMRA